MADDIDRLVAWARSHGRLVDVDANGHRRFYTSGGDFVVSDPATPSNPYRRLRDVVVAVRAHGLPWPPPGTKEQRARRRRGG